jgi:hypothetical protein
LHESNEHGNESSRFCKHDSKCYHDVDTGRFAVTNIGIIIDSAGYAYAIRSTNISVNTYAYAYKDRDLDSVRQCSEG